MFRQAVRPVISFPATSPIHQQAFTWKSKENTEYSVNDANKWQKQFTQLDISRYHGKIMVYKGSKVALSYPINKLLPQVPMMLHEYVRASRYCQPNGFFKIGAEIHKTSLANEKEAWERLYAVLYHISLKGIRGPVSNKKKKQIYDVIKVLDAEYEAQNNAEIIAITDEERSSMEKLDRERHARHNFLKKCLKKSK